MAKELKTIFYKKLFHKGENRLLLIFPYEAELTALIKKIKNVQWSQSYKCWHVADSLENKKEIYTLFSGIAEIKEEINEARSSPKIIEKTTSQGQSLSEEVKEKVRKFQYWLRSRRYSESTVKTYTDALNSFLRFHAGKELKEITNQDVIEYDNKYIYENRLSASYQNQVVNAIKLFFRKIENSSLEIELVHRPKKPRLLPNVLSKEEVELIFKATDNIKHKTALILVYSCGLRRSELLNLKIPDVDSKRKLLIIRGAKGNKDRVAPLSVKVIALLREYYLKYKPKKYLFEGDVIGAAYSAESLSQVLRRCVLKAKIKKPVSLHWLRHSYATHLLENGTDLRYIQEILGHRSSKTTEIYTHVSTKNLQNISSPFDQMNI